MRIEKNKTVNSGSRPHDSAGHGWYLWKLLEPPLKICGFEQVLAARLAFNDGGSGGFEAGRGNTRGALRRPEKSDSRCEAAADSRSLTDSFLFINQEHLIFFFVVFVLLVESLIATLMFSGAESSAQETIQTCNRTGSEPEPSQVSLCI